MSSVTVQCSIASLADLVYRDDAASSTDSSNQRFVVVPIAELPLSYSALNSPEILYLDSTNQILLRCVNGVTMIFDATFENSLPLATYRLNPNARMIYYKHSGTLAIADSKMLCFRRDYCGTFLLKTALKRPSAKTVSVELPLDEATKFLQVVSNDSDSEEILKQRAALRMFISHLRTATADLSLNSLESVVVEVNGKEMLEQLRSSGTFVGNSGVEIPREWMTFLWPFISMLAERVRLMMYPDRPYNFDYTQEWKGLNKEIMASEAARRFTFHRWPHMDYKQALPSQMAEAGFYHQPNTTCDDRVLCFSCFVCLVCWEPSEHERHSPNCRFVRNYTNPNVPLALTMSALSPFVHHLQVSHTSSLVFSAGNGEWVAVASRESPDIHLWQMGNVIQVKQWFTLNSEKFFSAVLDCTSEGIDHTLRKPQRVTWSDDLTSLKKSFCIYQNITGFSYDECSLKPALAALLIDDNCETVITALCTVGRPCLIEHSCIGAMTKKLSEQSQTLVVVAVSVNDSKLNRVRQQNQSSIEDEITTLNTMNRARDFIDAPPWIVNKSRLVDDGMSSGVPLRPFLALYQLDCAEFSSCRARSSSVHLENSKSLGSKVAHSDADDAEFVAQILMNTGDPDVLEWSGSTYAEQSGFVDIPNDILMGAVVEDSEMRGGPSKTDAKYDEKAKYVPITYEAPSLDISFVQCFNLPTAINNTSMEISTVLPMRSMFLVVVVNSKEDTTSAIQSAILLYLINFGKITITVQKEPIKAYYYNDFRIAQFSLANMDFIHTSHGSLNSVTGDYFDGAVIRTANDMVYFIDLNTNRLHLLCDEKVSQFTVMESGKVTLLTKNSGKFITVQVEQLSTHHINYDDEDLTVSSLFNRMTDSQKSEAPKGFDREEQKVKNAFSGDNTNILSSDYLSLSGLRKIWKLTRSDIGGPIRNTAYRSPHHLGGQLGYHLIPPPGWNEIPVTQRIRKCFIESPLVEGMIRTWFHQSDVHRSSNIHIFELVHLQHGLRLSHVDVSLAFHDSCVACPDIELRLYRQKLNCDILSSSSRPHKKTSFSGNIDLDEIETKCDLLAGPFHCAENIDFNCRSAKIQLPGVVFLPQPVQKGGVVIGFKSISYYFVLRALSDFSVDQAITMVKICERNKFKTSNSGASDKIKAASKRRIDDDEHTESVLNENSTTHGLTSRRGIQWIDELIVTVVKAKKISEPNERIERHKLIEMTDLHNSIVMLAAGIAPKTSHTQKTRTESEKLQQQNLAIGIIEWLIDNWVNTSSHDSNINCQCLRKISGDELYITLAYKD
ncbi:unnamed protein product [Thelazia callipaeda]|uniref:UBC core domain-containing protein n=1 Tax=Thelazia callipaeda TaxID=103827 RepID=A0A0N5D8K3_THECL|nr:unnamed protein product [Thelazia callipaeda]